ncbi:MAG: hypothetical protein KJ000_10975 [Pirellulaceae bacterium]|nr:hypothetical protein [Pirellulaceae bacterium]
MHDEFDWFVLSPLLFLGIFLFPIAAFVFYRSILLLRGRTEIVLDAENLRVIRKAGQLWSTRGCKLSQLGGFRREDPAGERYGLAGGLSNLVAVKKNGRTFRLLRMVPDGINKQLIGELSARIERLTGRADLTGADRILAEDLDAEVILDDSLAIGPRQGKPIGSNLAIEQRDNELTIHMHPLGFQKSESFRVLVTVMVLLAVHFFLTVTLVPMQKTREETMTLQRDISVVAILVAAGVSPAADPIRPRIDGVFSASSREVGADVGID